MGIRGHMTRSDFGKCSTLAAAVLTILAAGAFDAQAQQAIKNGDVLTGQLNAMRSPAKGKSVNTFQLVTSNDAQAAQLKGFIGKEVSVKVDEIACAQDAGQMSEAVVTKWSVVAKH